VIGIVVGRAAFSPPICVSALARLTLLRLNWMAKLGGGAPPGVEEIRPVLARIFQVKKSKSELRRLTTHFHDRLPLVLGTSACRSGLWAAPSASPQSDQWCPRESQKMILEKWIFDRPTSIWCSSRLAGESSTPKIITPGSIREPRARPGNEGWLE
jgi:hypothetical protein